MDKGVLPAQQLRDAVRSEWLRAGEWRIPPEAVQPASVDLRLGEHAWALRCSFLPDSDSTVEEKVSDLAFERLDLRDGATLERDRPYLVPLIEHLSLPPRVRGRANPKSSTGRLDVFTRVLTDRSHRFDEIAPGYEGRLYLEVVPRTFAIRVRTGLALNQVRLISGDARLRPHGGGAPHPLRRLLRPRLRLLARARPPRRAGGAGGARARCLLHGRAPPARLQAGLRAHGRRARRHLRRGGGLQLPAPAHDALKALPRARGRVPLSVVAASVKSLGAPLA